ncbi:hypothetical protein N7465_002214 [Penicillium sp. CMV-2018d]|nr:hypothetical protein N7465_002214 [Penicillium sp. CMV-2018d]
MAHPVDGQRNGKRPDPSSGGLLGSDYSSIIHDPCRTQDRSPKTPTKSHEHTRTESSFAIWDNGYVHRGTPQPYFKRFVSSYNSLGS